MSSVTNDPDLGGRYRLGGLIGVGGSASVFAAEDLRAPAGEPRRFAVKILHPHLCADDAARAAFFREAEQVRRLRHRNVVAVHDHGLHDGGGVLMPWIVLDLLDGPTLRDRVRTVGPLAPGEVGPLFEGVLAGLAAAHDAGIVHRDLSPQNIVLDGIAPDGDVRDAVPRIVDFGLADVTGRPTVGGDVLLSGPSPGPGGGAGSVVGNAQFMSPEQAQGLPVRAVSDLYQVGALLVFALTGEPPFPRPTTEQTLQAHVSAPPPVPSATVRGAGPFDRVVTRALSKTPAHRFRSAVEMRATLALAAAAVSAAPREPGRIPEPPVPAGTRTGLAAEAPTTVLPAAAGHPAAGEDGAPDGPGSVDGSGASGAVRSRSGLVAVVVAAIALGLAGWGVMTATAAPPASPAPSASAPPAEPSETSAASAAPTPVTTSAPSAAAPSSTVPAAPAPVAVPALYGAAADADGTLRALGLALGAVTRVESADPEGRILGQSPSPGSAVAPGSAVDLTVASGSNVVPAVSGLSVASATTQLQSAGFAVTPPSAASTARVTGSQPAANAVRRLGTTVTLVVDASTPTPGTTETAAPR